MQPGSAIVRAAVSKRCLVKTQDRLPRWCCESNVKSITGRPSVLRTEFECEDVFPILHSVANEGRIFPDAAISERGERRIVKCGRPSEISHSEGKMMKQREKGHIRTLHF